MKLNSVLLTAILAVSLTLAPAAASASDDDRNTAAVFGLGLGTAVLNLGYGPAKALFAAFGSVTGGLAWVFTGGNREVARAIVQSSVRGDYSIRPENLTMEEPLVFVGRDPRKYPPQSY
jgi:hypothetical protein